MHARWYNLLLDRELLRLMRDPGSSGARWKRCRAGCGGELAYYRTASGSEVDFIWTRGKHAVGIEVKASERWRTEYGRPLADLQRAGVVAGCYGIYLGDRALRDGPIRVLPLQAFLRELGRGRVLVAARRR